MNKIRNAMPAEVEALKPLLAETYRAIARFQRNRTPDREAAMRGAIARTAAALQQFRPLVPGPKRVYFDVVADPGDLPASDLVMALDMAIGSMHCELEQRAAKAQPEQPWSTAMLAVLRERSQARRVARRQRDDDRVLCRGIAASPGVAAGPVCLLRDGDDPLAGPFFGSVVVVESARPEWVGYLAGCAALVTDRGGALSHLAIIARELGVPAVVGTGDATSALQDGQWVEVDGGVGVVRACWRD